MFPLFPVVPDLFASNLPRIEKPPPHLPKNEKEGGLPFGKFVLPEGFGRLAVERLLSPFLQYTPQRFFFPIMKHAGNRLFLHALEQAVRRGSDGRELLLREEGEAYICSLCSLPTKPCKKYPTTKCSSMRLDGTLLKLIDEATVEFVHTGERCCVLCGVALKAHQLLKNPLVEVCVACCPRARRIRR